MIILIAVNLNMKIRIFESIWIILEKKDKNNVHKPRRFFTLVLPLSFALFFEILCANSYVGFPYICMYVRYFARMAGTVNLHVMISLYICPLVHKDGRTTDGRHWPAGQPVRQEQAVHDQLGPGSDQVL